jgi:hypothetical protein
MASPADLIWCALVASVLLTPLAVVTGSWFIMWVAALLSAYVSFLGLFTIGALTFLLTCLQLGGAFGLRRSEMDPNGWKVPLLFSLLVWALIVPVQVLSGIVGGHFLLGLYEAIPLVTVAGTIALFLAPMVGAGRQWY